MSMDNALGTLTAVIADNLALHQIGGFKCGFASGFRRCRTCLATADEIQAKFRDMDFIRRTKENHDFVCGSMTIEELRDHLAKIYGINGESPLSVLVFFHVIGGLAPDVMHDLLEGTLPRVICDVLKHCLECKYFTLDELNGIIRNFDYGNRQVIDRPSLIEKNHLKGGVIRQSAAQTWMLAINLPLMVGVRIKRNDRRWGCFLLLLQICRIAFLDSVTTLDILLLNEYVADFLFEYKCCFGRNITFKMHNLVHYGWYMLWFGPLVGYWCMRYEAKHSFFKNLHRHIHNSINIPYTLSWRHQQWQLDEFLTAGRSLLTVGISFGKLRKVVLRTALCGGQVAEFFGFQSAGNNVNLAKHVTMGSTKFQSNSSVVLCPLSSEDGGQFGLVIAIYEHNQRPVFVCKMYQTERFNHHLQAFEVTERRDGFCMAVSPNKLLKHHVYSLNSAGFYRPPARQHCVGWSAKSCAKDEMELVNWKKMFITVKSEIGSIVLR